MREFRELELCNDFLFYQVMQNEDVCKDVLSLILGKKVRKVRIHREHKVKPGYESRGIRLDVYLEDEDTYYVVEMQNQSDSHLPKRSRYYQGVIDVDTLASGEPVKSLRKSYVIFICTFALFDGQRHVYTFSNTCKEDPTIQLNDDTIKIFISTKGKIDDVTDEMKDFLQLVEDANCKITSNSPLVKNIKEQIHIVKNRQDLEVAYMTYETRMEQQFERGEEQGILIGERRGIALGEKRGAKAGAIQAFTLVIKHMLSDNRTWDEITAITGITKEEWDAMQEEE